MKNLHESHVSETEGGREGSVSDRVTEKTKMWIYRHQRHHQQQQQQQQQQLLILLTVVLLVQVYSNFLDVLRK